MGLKQHKAGHGRDVEQAASWHSSAAMGFAHHVVPGRHRRLDEIAVGLWRGEDVDDVESVAREHLGRVRVMATGAVTLRSVSSRRVRSVAHRHELGRRGRSEVPEVLVCDRAAADHTGTDAPAWAIVPPVTDAAALDVSTSVGTLVAAPHHA